MHRQEAGFLAARREGIQPRIDRGNQILNYTAPPLHPHIACAFAIAEECRKMEWWPE